MKKNFTIISFLFSLGCFSQLENAYLFAGAGTTYYQGDLNARVFPDLRILNFSFKGGIGYHLNERIGILAHYTKSSVSASDLYVDNAIKVARGISFKSPINEFGFNIKIRNIIKSQENLISYFLTGVNYFEFKPLTDISPYAYKPDLLLEEGYETSGINIPLGFGVGMWCTENLRIVWEASVHLTWTDYLDGVSQNGDPFYKDAFVDSHIMLLYSFSEPLDQKDKYQKKYR